MDSKTAWNGWFISLKQDFARAPLWFLAFEIPVFLGDWVTRGLEHSWMSRPLVALPVLLVFAIVPSFLSTAWTAFVLRKLDDSETVSFRDIVVRMCARLKNFGVAGLLVSLVIVCGLLLFIVPGIYFCVIYLFVPILILDADPAPSVSAALHDSKIAARQVFWPTFSFLILTFAFYFLIGQTAPWFSSHFTYLDSPSFSVSNFLSGAAEFLICAPFGTFANLVIARLYLNLFRTKKRLT